MSDPKKPDIKEIPVKAGIKSRTVQVDYLARVEGEGALYIEIDGQEVKDVKLKIFEPPRFFEAFMRGRHFLEAPDITSRICGICPIAYQMSAVSAMEQALGVNIPEEIQIFRRLLYCGEWIESHALHVYMLHAPDLLGLDDAIQMSKVHPEIVKDGLFLKKSGNQIVQVIGGREVHPINIRVGGFYKWPSVNDLQKLKNQLLQARDKALQAIAWLGQFEYPDFNKSYEFVSLSHPDEYPMARGKIISNKGLDISVSEFDHHIEEFQVPHSNALHAKLKNRENYFLGPMARYNLNREKLSKITLQAADSIHFEPHCTNPFRSIIVRSLEILYAFDEAIRILEIFKPIQHPFVEVKPKKAIGYGITEAPRGSLYHRYHIDEQGVIQDAKIVPPTSQNQYTIEKDLKEFVEKNFHLPQEKLIWLCEQAIRNYDPCISCATHFLKLHLHHAS
ncbi:MAG: Ni/Fe hydrogenase subunit alpha [Proteobacteria bacterium]|nr:Ni/Fe hydrogenase subunit alpha [Pseudomonadota bacterium]